jgi:tRNA nucleotidyltransferase (CCA-adding enzyme)
MIGAMEILECFYATHPAAGIVQKLVDANSRVFFVGGFVRDALRGVLAQDVDLEIYGLTSEELHELLEKLFPGQVTFVGKAFGVFKVFTPDGGVVDIALPRRDSKQGAGHRDFSVESDPDMTIEESVRRRDFTMNAILLDPVSRKIVDPLGGAQDLAEKILRVVDEATFTDDPLRVYRALQFVARFDLIPDEKTFALMRDMIARGDLSHLSPERITEEMRKLLLSEKPSRGLQLAFDLGLIARDYPELRTLFETEQEPEWHPEGNVWIHTLMVVDQAAKIVRRPEQVFDSLEMLSAMLGALCHDLGKPSTTQLIDGRVRSRGHEEAGREVARTFLSRFTFPSEATQAAEMCAAEHLKPVMLFKERERGVLSEAAYANAVRRLIRRITPMSWKILLAVSEADWRGRGTEEVVAAYEAGTVFEMAAKKLAESGELDPLLFGRDILSLGVPAGARVGQILRAIEDARDRGEIHTHEEALRLAQTLV